MAPTEETGGAWGEEWWDEDDEEFDPEERCVVCGYGPARDTCQECGVPLCHRHMETGAGFCAACPTKSYIPGKWLMVEEDAEALEDEPPF